MIFGIMILMTLLVFCKADIDSNDVENLIMAGMQIETSIIALNRTIASTKDDVINFMNHTITNFQPTINNFNKSLTFVQNQQDFINHIDETITFTRNEYENIKPIILKKINLIEKKITLKFIILASISFFGTGTLVTMMIITCFVFIIKKINRRQENTYIPMYSV